MNAEPRARRVERIKKLLALSNSAGANEHEVATALQMAQRLMEADGITDSDLAAADASENFTQSGAPVKVPAWENKLAGAIMGAFGCDAIYHGASWSFVGIDPAPEIAAYAFDVLRRQCLKARAAYVSKELKRVTVRANKIRRADLFCEGWIATAVAKARPVARTKQASAAIAALTSLTYGQLKSINTINRNDGRTLRDYELRDRQRGAKAGKEVDFHLGLAADPAPRHRLGNQ
ncbi:DUF2786 domain-containing protein [Nitrospirillum amazonense]|uniref:DUF2786 domain-containing protein n=1 Tax=Nitrospirillum amazonense TaxID=28077 RepID=UPI002412BA0A|nr:DUF2786 domain-containing protein [Nitrospirillum amazonense]MDG3444592.1 DUF2786 domain-containing protein [Nitrospirillum amazonense]